MPSETPQPPMVPEVKVRKPSNELDIQQPQQSSQQQSSLLLATTGTNDTKRRSSTSDNPDEGTEEAEDLLNEITNKQSANYRYVSFRPYKDPNEETNDEPKKSKKYIKQVSFDDMNIHDDDDFDDDYDYDDDVARELYRMKNGTRRQPGSFLSTFYSRGRQLSPGPGRLSPIASPRGTYEESDRLNFQDLRRLEMEGLKYPTTPITIRRCCSITQRHKLYERLYNGDLYPLMPVLPHRTILLYISARVHTWVALDWILNKFLENGDKVIVCATVDSSIFERHKGRRYQSRSRSRSSFNDPMDRYKSRSRPENIITIAKSIMDYCMRVINPEIIAKVTIELVAGGTKDVLKDLYKLYEPNLVCTGTKPNSHVGAPLRSWTSSKLSDRLVRNFPLPVILVPAMNMCDFEFALQSRVNGESLQETMNSVESINGIDCKTTGIAQKNNNNNNNNAAAAAAAKKEGSNQGEGRDEDDDDDDDDDDNNDDSSIASGGSSQSSNDSIASYNSFNEISRLYKDYRFDIQTKMKDLESHQLNADYYANIARAISDNSLDLCSEILQIQPNFIGKGSKLARAITGSNSFGYSPYKTKSLLVPMEKPEKIEREVPKEHQMSFKEVREQLKMNKIKSQAASSPPPPHSPSVAQHNPSLSSTTTTTTSSSHNNNSGPASDNVSPPPPSSQSLKWGGLEKPSKNRHGVSSQLYRNRLTKCLSDDDNNGSRINLEKNHLKPRSSHPNGSSIPSPHDTDGKKKWKKLKNWFKG
ncbi:hypothetical protein KGF56_003841 [Candida oxycetoniae]|uniref:Uncharacterized protein n=1 Tax=Candida oxycetoniae TaxID=497107 RepID=A0AAI9SUD4_9ASCO|nr:uncharacterized protein KGF56_003841 [Candida oxycetoniae]KAI3403253.2 hypothetical protein KGF56_003841 [Candida oxycetoniae]